MILTLGLVPGVVWSDDECTTEETEGTWDTLWQTCEGSPANCTEITITCPGGGEGPPILDPV